MRPVDAIGPRSLVKFCKPEHNILKGCRTLRLGTLDYFRKLPVADLRSDSEEGNEVLQVDLFARNASDDKALEEFEHAYGYAPPGNAYVDCSTQVQFPNAWIWCCSMMHAPGERPEEFGKTWSSDYTSEFSIGDPNEFAAYLTSMAASCLQVRHLSDRSLEQLKLLRLSQTAPLQCTAFHGPIVYVDEKKTVLSNGPTQTYLDELPIPIRPLFAKPARYQNEAEYRFAITVWHAGLGILSVGDHPVDVPITPIHSAHQWF
jgi:hypothetical protein